MVVAGIFDPQGVRAAMRDVDVVYHLIGGEHRGAGADLSESDIHSTRVITQAGKEAGIDRLVYISHLGANQSSAYPLMKAKGMAEQIIKSSGLVYSIFRSGIVFGPGDHFTEHIKYMIQKYPLFYFLPDQGFSQLQPIWVEDLTTCLAWSIESSEYKNQVIEVAGVENLSFREVSEIIRQKMGMKNIFINIQSSYLRMITTYSASANRNFPLTSLWLDYLAENHTCSLDSLPRKFGILPARFNQKIAYLVGTRR